MSDAEQKPEEIQSLERMIFDHTNRGDLEARLRMFVGSVRGDTSALPKSYYTDIVERIFAEAGYIKPTQAATPCICHNTAVAPHCDACKDKCLPHQAETKPDGELREQICLALTNGVHIYEVEDSAHNEYAISPEFPARWASDVLKEVEKLEQLFSAHLQTDLLDRIVITESPEGWLLNIDAYNAADDCPITPNMAKKLLALKTESKERLQQLKQEDL